MQEVAAEFARYGPLVVFINVLLAEAGLPLPAAPILVALGALVVQSGSQMTAIVLAGLAGALIADLCWYRAGRRYGRRVLGLVCRMSLSPDSCVRQTEAVFLRLGPWSVLLAKFLPGLSTISLVMAGAYRMRASTFLMLVTLRAVIFVAGSVVLGLMFRDAIGSLLDEFAQFGKLGLVSILAVLGLYILARWLRRQAFIRELRMERVTVEELRSLIADGHAPVILDVRPPAVRALDGIIPGAVGASAEEMDRVIASISREEEIVVYCACPSEASAAIATRHLKKAGFKRIRPLLGGIDAWIEAGGPLERPPA
jgi:membrane protein DedA with SNARE-associated domain/rhodanese-related sulfurtransferase